MRSFLGLEGKMSAFCWLKSRISGCLGGNERNWMVAYFFNFLIRKMVALISGVEVKNERNLLAEKPHIWVLGWK